MGHVDRNPPSPLEVVVSWDGVTATVTVRGELDTTTADVLTTCLLAVGAEHPDGLVLDLGGLVFTDVAGVRAVYEAYRLLEAGCPVTLRRPWISTRNVLGLVGLVKEGQLPQEGRRPAPADGRRPG
jgi:anti-anti-sigma factor